MPARADMVTRLPIYPGRDTQVVTGSLPRNLRDGTANTNDILLCAFV
jgi:hypothetical protein